MTVAVSIGAVNVPLAEVWRIVLHHLVGRGAVGDPALDQIVWEFRAPRVVLAALAGAGLAVSGVVLQAVVANPLADPYVLGVSSGASLGAVAVITVAGGALGGLGVSSAAFAGAGLAVVLVFFLGRRGGRLVTCGATSGPSTTLNLMQLFQQQYRIIGSFGASMRNIHESLAKMASGMLPVIDTEVPLVEFERGLARLESRQVFGKIVVTF